MVWPQSSFISLIKWIKYTLVQDYFDIKIITFFHLWVNLNWCAAIPQITNSKPKGQLSCILQTTQSHTHGTNYAKVFPLKGGYSHVWHTEMCCQNGSGRKIPKYGYLFEKNTPEHESWAAGDTSPTNPYLNNPLSFIHVFTTQSSRFYGNRSSLRIDNFWHLTASRSWNNF